MEYEWKSRTGLVIWQGFFDMYHVQLTKILKIIYCFMHIVWVLLPCVKKLQKISFFRDPLSVMFTQLCLLLQGWGCGYRTLQTMCSWIKYQLEATNQDLCSTSYPEDDSTPLHLHNEDAYGICVIASVEDSVSSSITRHENTLSDIGVSDKITQNISLGVGKASINEVPSIPNAQEALVTIGDKPSEFYGSHQWIGSYEVCLCIDYFFKVSIFLF